MRFFNPKSVGLGLAFAMSTSSLAMAAGTDAGTIVTNTISVSYVSGGNTITNNAADTATFTVDRRVDLSLEGQDGGNTVTAAQNSTDQVLTFLLTNEGNDASGYDIDVASTGTIGLTYDPAGAGALGTYHVVLSTDAVLDAGDTLVDVTGALNSIDLLEDEFTYILVVANVPAAAVDGQQDDFTVTARALNAGTNTPSAATPAGTLDLAVEDTVFADPGLDGIEADTEALVVAAPLLTFAKTLEVIDENRLGTFDCATGLHDPSAEAAIPGSCIEYTIAITNDAAASTAATTIVITDALPADTTYVTHATGDFDTVVFDAGTGPKGTITANLANLAPGTTADFNIRVTVD